MKYLVKCRTIEGEEARKEQCVGTTNTMMMSNLIINNLSF